MSPEARAQAEKWGWELPAGLEQKHQAEVDAFIHGAWVNGVFVATPAQTCTTSESQPLDDAQAALEQELAHCAPAVLQGQEEHERAMAWGRMLADLPSADPPTDHGCRLANYLAKQERRRNWTLTQSRRVNQEGREEEPE